MEGFVTSEQNDMNPIRPLTGPGIFVKASFYLVAHIKFVNTLSLAIVQVCVIWLTTQLKHRRGAL